MQFNLAEDVARMAKDIAGSYDVRVSAVGDIIKGTQQQLHRFHSDREKMGQEQRKSLADFTDHISKVVDQMREEFHKAQEQTAQQMRKMHAAMQDMFATMQAKRAGKAAPKPQFESKEEAAPGPKHHAKKKKQ